MFKTMTGYVGERSALIVTVACLAVMVCVVTLLAAEQRQHREEEIRARGISIARLLSGLPTSDLVNEQTYGSLLRLVSFSQGTDDFAYAALVDESGSALAEVTAEGVIVPAALIANEPSGWIGERELEIRNPGRRVIEYHAPVFENGLLAGQIRLGFFMPQFQFIRRDASVAAGIALLVFLLAPLFYVLLRKEIRPLASAGAELEKLLKSNKTNDLAAVHPPISQFTERFNQFVDFSQSRIRDLEDDRGQLVASAKLISYKKTRIEAVLQTLPQAILILDEHGKVTYANDRVPLMLGASKDQVLRQRAREWCGNPIVIDYLSRYETSSAPRYTHDTVFFRPDEHGDRTFALNGYPLFSPNEAAAIKGTVVVISDVTQESLARESRSEFVAHLGHELKTPLNTLSLYSEVLLDDAGQSLEERVAAVNTIHDETERLTGLVNNLLSITRIEMGSIDLEKQRTRLSELLEDIADNLGRLAIQQGITVELDLPHDLNPVSVDKELLRTAINNLVSNAIKYNQSGGKVTLSAEETDEAVLIHVADTGLGVGEEDQARIFDKFFRSESHEVRERSGHGLGLSLTRQIVELHDGQISIESEPGVGSNFTITLWKRSGLVKKAI